MVSYCEPLITKPMKTSVSPFGMKIDEEKENHPINNLSKIHDIMMLFYVRV